MTLQSAWYRYHLLDHESGVYPLKFLTATDVIEQSNGRRNLSNLKMLIKYMIDKCKQIDCYVADSNENDVNEMNRKVASHVLNLSNNTRCELFSWRTHV